MSCNVCEIMTLPLRHERAVSFAHRTSVKDRWKCLYFWDLIFNCKYWEVERETERCERKYLCLRSSLGPVAVTMCQHKQHPAAARQRTVTTPDTASQRSPHVTGSDRELCQLCLSQKWWLFLPILEHYYFLSLFSIFPFMMIEAGNT